MRGVLRRHVLRAPIAEARRIDAGDEMLAGAEKYRRARDVDREVCMSENSNFTCGRWPDFVGLVLPPYRRFSL